MFQIQEPGAHKEEKLTLLGIDLGTTNTVIAYAQSGEIKYLEDEAGEKLIPSGISYDAAGNVMSLEQQGPFAFRSLKRFLDAPSEDVPNLCQQLGYELKSPINAHPVLGQQGLERPLAKLYADQVKALHAHVEKTQLKAPYYAVITVPAYFSEPARQMTKLAATSAGFKVLRLISEPTAAAYAYGLDHKKEGIFLIYDCGGGTFDVSVLRLEEGIFQVLATGGDMLLGGDDIDAMIAEKIGAAWQHEFQTEIPKSLLLEWARTVKEALSRVEKFSGPFSFQDRTLTFNMERAALNTLLEAFIEKTHRICEAVLEDANIEKEEIEDVILVGGTTRIPRIKESLATLFNRKPLDTIDPDLTVAKGAALHAQALAEGSETLLLDLTPLSLGVETMGGIVETIIPRNTPIPTAYAQDFTTYQDNQTALSIHVLQGERELVKDCRSLARFSFTGIPPMPAGMARVKIMFSLDVDGLLTVSAQEQSTGQVQTVSIMPSNGLTESKMQEMLEESFSYAQEDIHERQRIQERTTVERMLLSAEKILSDTTLQISQDMRGDIKARMQDLEAALADDKTDVDTFVIRRKALDAAMEDLINQRIQGALDKAVTTP